MIYILRIIVQGRNKYNPEPRVFALLSKTEQEANVNPVRPVELQRASYSNPHVTQLLLPYILTSMELKSSATKFSTPIRKKCKMTKQKIVAIKQIMRLKARDKQKARLKDKEWKQKVEYG